MSQNKNASVISRIVFVCTSKFETFVRQKKKNSEIQNFFGNGNKSAVFTAKMETKDDSSVHPVQDRVTTETEKSYDRRTTSLGCQMTSLITHINQGKQITDHQLKVAAE
jgi:hypothetical protein